MIDWKPISEPPKECGWFLAALNPVNYEEVGVEGCNSWREHFGCTKVWYNPGTHPRWWEPDAHKGYRSQPVDHRLTHWAFLPAVPVLEELVLPKKKPRGWGGREDEQMEIDVYRRVL